MPKRYRSRAERTELVVKLEASDLTLVEFARQRELSKSTSQRWWSRLRREIQERDRVSAVPFVRGGPGIPGPTAGGGLAGGHCRRPSPR